MKILLLLLAQIALSAALQINCQYQDSENFKTIGSVYECNVTNLADLVFPIVVLASGNTEVGKSLMEIKLVTFENFKNLTYIPKQISNVFPNFKALKISNSGIETLYGADFIEYSELIWLSLTSNKISRVPDDFLRFLPNILYLDLSSNSIKEIGFYVLNQVKYDQIQYIGFNNNTCINKDYVMSNDTNEPSFHDLLTDIQLDCLEVTTAAPVTTSPQPSTPSQPQSTQSPKTEPSSQSPTVPTTPYFTLPSTTSAPTCQNVDLTEEVCRLREAVQSLNDITRSHDLVFKKMEDVLNFVQEALRQIVSVLNNQIGPKPYA